MVYDCFQFFNEIEMLKMRMHILNEFVDKFVISESTVTFSGDKKPLNFEANREVFKEFEEKIIYNIVEDTPEGTPFERDSFQKCAVARGLKNCKKNDIIIFSDVDEIPNPVKIKEIVSEFNPNLVYHFAQRMFYCYLNLEEVSGSLLSVSGEFSDIKKKKWLGTRMCSYGMLDKYTLEDLRKPELKEIGIRVPNGGWHFGYMGGKKGESAVDRITYKIKSAAHQEFNTEKILSGVEKKVKERDDILGRNAKFKRVDIDETFPQYLMEHKEEYDYLIMPKEPWRNGLICAFKRVMKNLEKKIKKLMWRTKQVVKKALGWKK